VPGPCDASTAAGASAIDATASARSVARCLFPDVMTTSSKPRSSYGGSLCRFRACEDGPRLAIYARRRGGSDHEYPDGRSACRVSLGVQRADRRRGDQHHAAGEGGRDVRCNGSPCTPHLPRPSRLCGLSQFAHLLRATLLLPAVSLWRARAV